MTWNDRIFKSPIDSSIQKYWFLLLVFFKKWIPCSRNRNDQNQPILDHFGSFCKKSVNFHICASKLTFDAHFRGHRGFSSTGHETLQTRPRLNGSPIWWIMPKKSSELLLTTEIEHFLHQKDDFPFSGAFGALQEFQIYPQFEKKIRKNRKINFSVFV